LNRPMGRVAAWQRGAGRGVTFPGTVGGARKSPVAGEPWAIAGWNQSFCDRVGVVCGTGLWGGGGQEMAVFVHAGVACEGFQGGRHDCKTLGTQRDSQKKHEQEGLQEKERYTKRPRGELALKGQNYKINNHTCRKLYPEG